MKDKFHFFIFISALVHLTFFLGFTDVFFPPQKSPLDFEPREVLTEELFSELIEDSSAGELTLDYELVDSMEIAIEEFESLVNVWDIIFAEGDPSDQNPLPSNPDNGTADRSELSGEEYTDYNAFSGFNPEWVVAALLSQSFQESLMELPAEEKNRADLSSGEWDPLVEKTFELLMEEFNSSQPDDGSSRQISREKPINFNELSPAEMDALIEKTLALLMQQIKSEDRDEQYRPPEQGSPEKNNDTEPWMSNMEKSFMKKLLGKCEKGLTRALEHALSGDSQCQGGKGFRKGQGREDGQGEGTNRGKKGLVKGPGNPQSTARGRGGPYARGESNVISLEKFDFIIDEMVYHIGDLAWALGFFPENKLVDYLATRVGNNLKNQQLSEKSQQTLREMNLPELIKKSLEILKDQDKNKQSAEPSKAAGKKQTPATRNVRSLKNRDGLNSLSQGIAMAMLSRLERLRINNPPKNTGQGKTNIWELLENPVRYPDKLKHDPFLYQKLAKKMLERNMNSDPVKRFKGSTLPIPVRDENLTQPREVYLKKIESALKKLPTASELIKPDYPTHAFGGAPRKKGPIKIDGDLKEWVNIYPFKLTGKPMGSALPPFLHDCNFLLTQWDNTGMYFAYWIRDQSDKLPTVASFWEGDALELFFDPKNLKKPFRTPGESFQFWLWPPFANHKGSRGKSVFISKTKYKAIPLDSRSIIFRSKKYLGGYSCEAFIRADLLGKFKPLPGKTIGFNFSINNGQGIFLRWLTNMGANTSHHPDLWGDLLLLGSDAQISVIPEKFILPGDVLNVTVKDPDMNFYPGVREKVALKIGSSLTGDAKIILLTEKNINSGVFTGQTGTYFSVDKKDPNYLHIRPGDKITLTYLDQFTGTGQKNKPVQLEYPVARAVFHFGNSPN